MLLVPVLKLTKVPQPSYLTYSTSLLLSYEHHSQYCNVKVFHALIIGQTHKKNYFTCYTVLLDRTTKLPLLGENITFLGAYWLTGSSGKRKYEVIENEYIVSGCRSYNIRYSSITPDINHGCHSLIHEDDGRGNVL